MEIFKLNGSVYVDTAKAEDSLQKTDKKALNLGETFGKIGKTAAAVGTAVVGMASAAVAGVMDLANNTAAVADEIDKASIRMGMGAEDYQRLAYAAGQCGVEMSTMEKAAKQLEGTDMSMDEAMAQVMAMGTAEERAAKAAELFGEAVAYKMSPLIEQSQEDYDGLIDRADELGLVMGEDAVKAGVVLGDTISDVKQSFSMMAANLGSAVVPVVQMFADKIIEYTPMIQSLVERLAPVIVALFEQLVPPIMELADTLLPIIFDLIEQLLPPITEILVAIMPVITQTLQMVMPFLMQIVQAVLPVVVNLLKTLMPILQPILDLLAPILQMVMEIIQPLMDIINQILPPLINILVNGLGGALRKVGEIFTNLWAGIKDGLKTGLNFCIKLLNGMIDGVNALIKPLTAIIEAVGNLFGANWAPGTIAIPHIPMLAKGGIVTEAGSAIVGENGPELVQLNKGASVTPLNGAAFDEVSKKLEKVIEELEKLGKMGVYINGKRLVGEIAEEMDYALGKLAMEA